LSNLSSRACVTFTSTEAGDKALQNFSLEKFEQYTLVLRPFASKESHMVFVRSLLSQGATE
jgi:hypothetical protein